MMFKPCLLNYISNVDGDVVTLAVVKDRTFHKIFMPMCPTYTFIDRANGKYNEGMNFDKDYAGILAYIWDMDRRIHSYMSNPDQDTYDGLIDIGLTVGQLTEDDPEESRKQLLRDHMKKLLK